jgi:Ni,Fe-hydrogenase III large subunit
MRPWLDHGRGDSVSTGNAGPRRDALPFLPVEGEHLHRIPVGPVHAGIIEPGHFRFTASGETIVRLEERLGYVHKGIEGLMAGADLARGAELAGRVSGDSTVAYAFAFARAVEAALQVEAPRRAQWLRALMAELERLANHFGDIGAICNDAAFSLLHAHCGVLREQVLRTADSCFGHRLMRDVIVPGGVARDLDPDGAAAIRALVAEVRRRFPHLVVLYDNTASLQDRTVGTGILKPLLARRFGAGGFVGRASGRAFDARRGPGYAPYDQLEFEVPGRDAGDVDARVWIRIHEVEQSLGHRADTPRMPAGPLRGCRDGAFIQEGRLVEASAATCSWVRWRPGRIERCHLRDPSWFRWRCSGAIEQHRCGLPALQQVVQLHVLRPRSLRIAGDAQAALRNPRQTAAHRKGAGGGRCGARGAGARARADGAQASRAQPGDPPGGRRLLQRL